MVDKQYFKDLCELINHVIKETGQTKSSISHDIGVVRQMMGQWCKLMIPPGRCHAFSECLHKIISIEMLRPDIFLKEAERKHLDFDINKTLILQRLEAWKNEQRIKINTDL